jgi:hypothetical protein
MFHPFDGFWDLKHEKRGSLRAAFTFMAITAFGLFYRSVGTGYVMNPKGGYSTIFMQILVVVVPVALFAIANWCLTTLFEGEGSLRDIVISIGYSLLPLPLTMIPTTLASNYIVDTEVTMIKLIVVLGFIWAGFLLFFGTMVTHDYTMPKNIVTTAGTIIGMAFIMFLAILFGEGFCLILKHVTFATDGILEHLFHLLVMCALRFRALLLRFVLLGFVVATVVFATEHIFFVGHICEVRLRPTLVPNACGIKVILTTASFLFSFF